MQVDSPATKTPGLILWKMLYSAGDYFANTKQQAGVFFRWVESYLMVLNIFLSNSQLQTIFSSFSTVCNIDNA